MLNFAYTSQEKSFVFHIWQSSRFSISVPPTMVYSGVKSQVEPLPSSSNIRQHLLPVGGLVRFRRSDQMIAFPSSLKNLRITASIYVHITEAQCSVLPISIKPTKKLWLCSKHKPLIFLEVCFRLDTWSTARTRQFWHWYGAQQTGWNSSFFLF